MKRVSFSLPDDLYISLEGVRRSEGAKRSQIIARALKEHLSRYEKMSMKGDEKRYPTVLWKLKQTGNMALRSPKLTERRIGERWVIEEY